MVTVYCYCGILGVFVYQIIQLNNIGMGESQKCFQTAVLLFYENKLEQSLVAINRSIDLKPANSVSYSNRALIKYHLGKPEEAQEDLSLSATLNPLNYMAYFNAASIRLRLNCFYGFIRNIQSAISVLKLIVGRRNQQKTLIMASLDTCKNNFDAFIVLVLMEVQRQNFKEAQAIIQKYGQFQTDKAIVRQIRQKISLMVGNYSIEYEEEFYQILQQQVKKEPLVSSITLNDTLEEEQESIVKLKLEEFNTYYKLVNQSIGKVNHLPKNTQKYILMDELAYPKGKTFNFHSQTEMIVSH